MLKIFVKSYNKEIKQLFYAGAYRVETVYVDKYLITVKVHTENRELDNDFLLNLFPKSNISVKSHEILDGPGGPDNHIETYYYDYVIDF